MFQATYVDTFAMINISLMIQYFPKNCSNKHSQTAGVVGNICTFSVVPFKNIRRVQMQKPLNAI